MVVFTNILWYGKVRDRRLLACLCVWPVGLLAGKMSEVMSPQIPHKCDTPV